MSRLIPSKIKPTIVWRMHTNGYCATIEGEPINIAETFADDYDMRFVLVNEGRRLFGSKELHRVEFKVGQEVTFHNYEGNDPIPAVVVEANCDGRSFLEDDHRVFYQLSGRHRGNSLNSLTTGLSIKESIYFKLAPSYNACK
jgi:hypothetical protein